MKIGFVGFSDESCFDEIKARRIIDTIFDSFSDMFSNEEEIYIVSGGTNMGIPRLVYEKATLENEKFGVNYICIGVMAKEGYNYSLYPCDHIHAIGKHFGDESQYFIDSIDRLYKIGGGTQSNKEFQMALTKGISCIEIPNESIQHE